MAKSLTKCEAKSCMSKDQVLRAVAESYLDSLDRRRVPIQDDVVVIDITEEAMNDNNNAVTNVASDASCNKYLHYGNKVVVLFRSAFLLQKVFFFSAFFPSKQPLFSRKAEDLQLLLQ